MFKEINRYEIGNNTVVTFQRGRWYQKPIEQGGRLSVYPLGFGACVWLEDSARIFAGGEYQTAADLIKEIKAAGVL